MTRGALRGTRNVTARKVRSCLAWWPRTEQFRPSSCLIPEASDSGALDALKDALVEHGRQLKDIREALDGKVVRDGLEARR